MISVLTRAALRTREWFSGDWQTVVPVIMVICIVLVGHEGNRVEASPSPVPTVVTADIQAGIEKHIDDQSRLSGGYFELPFEGRVLHLKLVRVHIEYLANLGPRRHFACVDLAGTDGEVYDVDFFLEGDPGAMSVTETTVHKINGQPLYAWEQKEDRTWQRVHVENASQELLGVITDRDVFEFLYRATLPKITSSARMWIPLPTTDAFQTVEIKSIKTPGKQTTLDEPKHGNKVLFLELGPEDSKKTVEIRYQVQRLEKSAYAEKAREPGVTAFLTSRRRSCQRPH